MSLACLVELPGPGVFPALGDGTDFLWGFFLLTDALGFDVFLINHSFYRIAATTIVAVTPVTL
jgi:hypothetical protein